MSSAEGLFHVDTPEPAPPAPKESTDRRRTRRQKQALAAGKHPISVYVQRTVPLHADAAPADDRTAPGLRCRTCVRLTRRWGYLKCANVSDTHSAASDIRAWWSACVNYEAADE